MGHPIAFPGANNIPIVGQPFEFKNWFPTVQIVCKCEAMEPVLLVGNGITPCPKCQRKFAIGQIQYNAQSGQLNIGIAIVTETKES